LLQVQQTMTTNIFDIAIIGAGPVGAMLALQLAQANLTNANAARICLIDSRAESPSTSEVSNQIIHPLERTLALSAHTFSTLQSLQVPLPTCAPIEQIHISQQGQFGRTVLSAQEIGEAALGHTILYSQLIAALDQTLLTMSAENTLRLQFSSKVESINQHADHAVITLAGDQTITTKLLVIADGGNSLDWLRGVAVESHDYGKSAVLAQVNLDRSLNGLAYERFTEVGPLALLPVSSSQAEHRAALVWVTTPEHAEHLVSQPEPEFVSAFQAAFGSRAGRFVSVHQRKRYPLRHRTVQPRYGQRFVVIGNAAQTLHPVAGQGLNLGMRDASELADLLTSAIEKQQDCGTSSLLAQYDANRERDAQGTAGFTRLLTDIFERDESIIRAGRGLALTALDLMPFARKALLNRLLYGARS
jgi:2-octaprenyl-6-methoxyphenol hydroxylase